MKEKKELDCLYEISAALAETDSDKKKLFTVFSNSLAKAMTYPDAAEVTITVRAGILPYTGKLHDLSVFHTESTLENGDKITISVSYNQPLEFVEREKKNL